MIGAKRVSSRGRAVIGGFGSADGVLGIDDVFAQLYEVRINAAAPSAPIDGVSWLDEYAPAA